MQRFFRSTAIFLISLIWLAFLMPWDGFIDPDAFYHAKMSLLFWQHGPIHSFPWLDLTELARHPADLHLLFHAFVAPFTAAFGMFQGLRIASVILAALCVVVFDWMVRQLVRLEGAMNFAPTVLLLVTQPFLTRLLLAKATPLALICFFLGLTFVWLRKPWLALVAGALFAFSHAGWMYLVCSAAILTFGDALYRIIVETVPWREAVKRSPWRETIFCVFGVALGLFFHPDFPENVLLSWTQVVTIGLGTPFNHVLLGNEWLPSVPSELFASFAVWICVALLGLAGLLLAPKKKFDSELARFVTSFGWVLAAFVALTLKSRRNTEYLAPVVALWCASLWSLVDVRELSRSVRRMLLVVVACVLSFLMVRDVFNVWKLFHPVTFPDNVYQSSMSAISSRAQPGDRVFHSSWDEFPMLFAADDRLHYISGLDPTFLYVASSTLSDRVRDLTWNRTTSTKEEAWVLIKTQLSSKFVFISRKNHQKFLDLIASDPRYEIVASSTDSAAFELR